MFAYIKGRLEFKGSDYIIIETGGIGYRIHTSLSTIEAVGSVGNETRVYTYLYVREDIINLYGFATPEELGMFQLLLSVSGIGPKVALSILSSISPSKFGLAVITDDVKTLVKAQGVGAKMAQRIILELKDKMEKSPLVDVTKIDSAGQESQAGEPSRISDAVSALMVLGYSAAEAKRAVASVYSDDLDLETIIRYALKQLAL